MQIARRRALAFGAIRSRRMLVDGNKPRPEELSASVIAPSSASRESGPNDCRYDFPLTWGQIPIGSIRGDEIVTGRRPGTETAV